MLGTHPVCAGVRGFPSSSEHKWPPTPGQTPPCWVYFRGVPSPSLWDTNPSMQGSSVSRPLLRHTRPGKTVYWLAEKKDQVFQEFSFSVTDAARYWKATPATSRISRSIQDRRISWRNLLAGFGPGWYFIFHLSSGRSQRTFLYPPLKDPPSRRPAPTPLEIINLLD
ncbi:hypothetical protein WA026_019795 [Henosepilachna vigintioctopunctata]|uniref:Uncharacterized protein n=1 Tax=Henosepilachna vigintioctopunctata TaxID=420089 RepID=A0AAW1VG75_9CUCU